MSVRYCKLCRYPGMDRRYHSYTSPHAALQVYQNPRIPSTLRTSLVNLRLSSTGNASSSASSFGSEVHPSIGNALARGNGKISRLEGTVLAKRRLAFIPVVADWGIIHKANPAEVFLY